MAFEKRFKFHFMQHFNLKFKHCLKLFPGLNVVVWKGFAAVFRMPLHSMSRSLPGLFPGRERNHLKSSMVSRCFRKREYSIVRFFVYADICIYA